MRLVATRAAIALAAGLLLPAVGKAQVAPNQVDTFESGTTLNWTNGQGGIGESVPAGGMGGPNDRYLRVESGIGAATRLVAFNRAQWTGNYTAAQVTQIEMDLINLSATALAMRVAFRTGTSGSTTPGFVSSVPFSLPADGQWRHATFRLTDADFTPINSPPMTFSQLLSQPPSAQSPNGGPPEMRILHSPTPALQGAVVTAAFGVDNIRAVSPVPEPAGGLTLLLAAGLAAARRRRARQSNRYGSSSRGRTGSSG